MSKNQNVKNKDIQGIVKWFDDKLGYGFISANGLEADVFVHYSEIQRDGYKSLKENDIVLFDHNVEKNIAEKVRTFNNEV